MFTANLSKECKKMRAESESDRSSYNIQSVKNRDWALVTATANKEVQYNCERQNAEYWRG